jgi:hypothetical protein
MSTSIPKPARSNVRWWILFAMTILVVTAWPPQDDKSLATKFVNWVVDPTDQLPILPPQLPLGLGDDPDAVNAHDLQVREYDTLYMRGGWTRKRLELKVADDPFDPNTTRQILVGIAAVVGLIVWRLGSRRE